MRALPAALNLGLLRVAADAAFFSATTAPFRFCPLFALTFAHRALWAAAMRALAAALNLGRSVAMFCLPLEDHPLRALIAASSRFNSLCNVLRSALSVRNMST
jgi:hypothetical protein